MRRRLVAGNWKMNGGLSRNAELLTALVRGWKGVPAAGLAVCAPFPYLAQVQTALSGSSIGWGAQNVSEYASGAYTGEVSAAMLKEFGCRYVIVGHSERRQLLGEDDATVGRKASAALGAGLTPIVCVGETLAERERGETSAVVMRQWRAVAALLGGRIADVVVAYEPVWAIGTGRTATPEQAQEVHAALRAELGSVGEAVPLLYGGSVKKSNAAELFRMPDIDGGLVGGASLDADEFLGIGAALG